MESATPNGGQRRVPCRPCLSPYRVTGRCREPQTSHGHLGILPSALLLALWLGKYARGLPVVFLFFFALQRRGDLALNLGSTFFSAVVGRNGPRYRRFFLPSAGVFALAAVAAVIVIQRLLGTRTRRCELVSAMVLGGLFVLGVVLTPSVPWHAPLKATRLIQFLNSWSAVLGWPIKLVGPLL